MSETRTREQRVDEYLQRIVSAGDFPALSERLTSLLGVLGQDTTMQALANIVLRDYSLTLKVLRTANTFHYNRSGRRVLSVTQAMVLLGVENVRDLASSLVLLEHYARMAPALKQLMALSMLTASHARLAAEHIGHGRPEEAHLAAMFRNVGEVLIACHFPADYAAVMAAVRDRGVPLGDAAEGVLQFRVEDLGAAACRHWGLDGFGRGTGATPVTDLDRLVAFGHDLTSAVYRQVPTESPQTVTLLLQRYGHTLSMTADTLQSILHDGCAETKEMFASLGLSLADLRLDRQVDAAVASLATTADPATPLTDDEDPVDVALAHGPSSAQARQQLTGELEATIADHAHFDVNAVLLMVLEAIVRAGPFSRAVFCVLNDQRTELLARFGLGEGVDALIKRLRLPLTLGAQGLGVGASLLRRTQLLAAVTRNPSADEARLLAFLAARSALVLPIVLEGRTVGAILADRMTADPPDAAAVAFVVHLRDLAVQAMLRARSARAAAASRSVQLGPEERRDLVLRLIRGETAEAVSRETHVTVRELERWKQAFLEAATRALGE